MGNEMGLLDFIGFIISSIVLSMLFFKKKKEDRLRKNQPDEDEEELQGQSEKLKNFRRSIDQDMRKIEKEEKSSRAPAKASASRITPRSSASQQKAKRPDPDMDQKKAEQLLEGELLFNKASDNFFLEPPQKRTVNPPPGDNGYRDPFGSRIFHIDLSKSLDVSTYSVIRFERPSRALMTLRELSSLKKMVIYREILGPPKGLCGKGACRTSDFNNRGDNDFRQY